MPETTGSNRRGGPQLYEPPDHRSTNRGRWSARSHGALVEIRERDLARAGILERAKALETSAIQTAADRLAASYRQLDLDPQRVALPALLARPAPSTKRALRPQGSAVPRAARPRHIHRR